MTIARRSLPLAFFAAVLASLAALVCATLAALATLAFAATPALAAGPPVVVGESTYVKEVTSSSATLVAEVDPEGSETSYSFETSILDFRPFTRLRALVVSGVV